MDDSAQMKEDLKAVFCELHEAVQAHDDSLTEMQKKWKYDDDVLEDKVTLVVSQLHTGMSGISREVKREN